MRHQADGQAEPLCKFGPGGDFIAVWQPEPAEPLGRLSSLTELLTSTLGIAAIMAGLRPSNLPVDLTAAARCGKYAACVREKVKNVVGNSRPHSTADSAPATTIADSGVLSREPMLFPHNSGIGSRIKHKPKYRIRAYRRAAQKRTAFRLSEQGSLFELDLPIARTA